MSASSAQTIESELIALAKEGVDFASVPEWAASRGAGKMNKYRYHVVPFIGVARVGLFSKENAQTISSQLESVINHYSEQGWEFYSLEKVNIQVKPGCLGTLLGFQVTFVTFDQIVFRQPIQ